MEYQKIINLFDNTPNESSQFRTKNGVKINYDVRGMYNTNSQIKFKTSMLKSSLCDYSDTYILVKGTTSIAEQEGDNPNNNNKEVVVFKDCAPFTDCISEINNTQIDNAKDIDVVMPMYNLIEHSHNYSKTSASLWMYYRDEPFLDINGAISNFPAATNNSASFKFKQKITGKTPDGGRKDVEIMVLLKYLSNFWRTL